MIGGLTRGHVLPETDAPTGADPIARGRERAAEIDMPAVRFQRERGVISETAYKSEMAAARLQALGRSAD